MSKVFLLISLLVVSSLSAQWDDTEWLRPRRVCGANLMQIAKAVCSQCKEFKPVSGNRFNIVEECCVNECSLSAIRAECCLDD